MLDKIREKTATKLIATVIVLLVAGIALIWLKAPTIKAYINGNIQFETLKPDEIENDMMVDITVDTNFGAYMEMVGTTYYDNGYYYTGSGSHYTANVYYVIWTGDDYAEDYKFMGIKVPYSEERTMEAIAEATYNEKYVEPVTYSGVISKMLPKEYEYFKEYFQEAGWTEEEIEERTLPYYIGVGESPAGAVGSATMVFVVMVVIGFLLFLICIWKP